MTIETKLEIGQQVCHITEPTGSRGVVTAFMLKGTNHSYLVMWSHKEDLWHLDFELVKHTSQPATVEGFSQQ